MTTAAFDMKDYKALALRTKAPATEKHLKQLVRSYEFLKDILEEARDQGLVIDKLKKYSFYGKDSDELVEQMTPTYPVGSKAERIKQCLDLLHGLVGIIGECGELAEEVLLHIEEDKSLDILNVREEGSDILWFLNLIVAFAGTDIPNVGHANILKLKFRHPKAFAVVEHAARNKSGELKPFESNSIVLDEPLENDLTITISGKTASGKTTVMQAIARLLLNEGCVISANDDGRENPVIFDESDAPEVPSLTVHIKTELVK